MYIFCFLRAKKLIEIYICFCTDIQEADLFSEKDGLPRNPFPSGWKGERGLYAVGFTKRGLLGASFDAKRIAEDIQHQWIFC